MLTLFRVGWWFTGNARDEVCVCYVFNLHRVFQYGKDDDINGILSLKDIENAYMEFHFPGW